MLKIIFHLPFPIDPKATDASGIRPQRMLEAFKSIGYHVDVICGYGAERKESIAHIKNNILQGEKYAFLYSESSLAPTLLTAPHRFPTHPTLDFGFFEFCKTRNIPIGLFYRDIYWLFPEYKKRYSWLKYQVGVFFHRYDLKKYQALVNKVYLPSMEMANYVPLIARDRFTALPPGHNGQPLGSIARETGVNLRLLYVGGVGQHYCLQELWAAVAQLPNIQLTICTREKDWLLARTTYPTKIPQNIRVVHKSGEDIIQLYKESDIALLFVQSSDYWKFAVPFKLFEYIGMHKPIIASEGTLAGEFVATHGIGWSIPYSSAALSALLNELDTDDDSFRRCMNKLNSISDDHTWIARAKKVASDFSSE